MIKKLIPVVIFVLIAFNISFGKTDFTGKYTLHLSSANSQEQSSNFLEIDSISGRKITGVVGLDFSIESETGIRMPWQKFHKLPFKGKYDSQKDKLLLSVLLPWNKRFIKYTFIGYFIQTKDMKGIVGLYLIDKKEQGGFLAN